MQQTDPKLMEHYERKTRKGFPLGEVREDLLQRGYTTEEADAFTRELGSRIAKKGAGKEAGLLLFMGVAIVLLGLVMILNGSKPGIWFILTGAIRVVYSIVKARRNDTVPGES
ncbi:MAG: hypothetical protein JWP27_2301 [Flaviaesturariibacter sp.]|nr:hypothetical protein [Flaviaesturariibacter sp.]